MAIRENLSYRRKLILLSIFAIAMAYLEAVVVIYIREIYYPEGFAFPLKIMPNEFLVIEIFREFSTIIMLISVALLMGKKAWEKFGFFIFIFGLWDIFYYLWLKITIDWPASIFQWDVLFLIPLPWIGPVIAPTLVALMMIIFGVHITLIYYRGFKIHPPISAWLLSILGSAVILFSFMHDSNAILRQMPPKSYLYQLLFGGLLFYVISYFLTYKSVKK